MITFFRLTISDAIRSCQSLAKHASIEPLIEDGTYIGFIIELQDTQFEKYISLRQASLAFMRIIEERIELRDFAGLYKEFESSKLDSAGAPRVVFNARGCVIYNW